MKMIGYEVENYGAFDQQFVPIQPGVSVIAGLNNAGKTALLRALTTFSNPAVPYARADGSSRVNLIFSIEPGDLPEINGEPTMPFVRENSGFWIRAKFRLRDPKFAGADLIDPRGKTHEWILSSGTNLQRFNFSQDGTIAKSQNILQTRTNLGPTDLEKYFPGFMSVTNSLYIPPRREGSGQNPANANTTLPLSGANLASYLFTLQINQTEEYEVLNSIFCAVFPYLRRVNAQIINDKVEVRITYRDNDQIVPLSACGTGVEQLLILLTCVMRSPDDAIIAIDEPHSFLHPSAERALVRFFQKYPRKTIILATHSAIMVNTVSSERILYVTRKGTPTLELLSNGRDQDVTTVLAALGYENSDVLFNNKLIFVEGPTEAGVLPKLLNKAGIPDDVLSWIGMPQLEGANPIENIDDLAKQVIRYEKLVSSLGRGNLPRLYLLDGDRDRNAVGRLKLSQFSRAVFLKRPEIENYILEPQAIARAIVEDARSQDVQITMTSGEVEQLLLDLHSKGIQKGSQLLETVYGAKLIRYSKVHSGQLIAEYLSKDWAPLQELRLELNDFLLDAPKAVTPLSRAGV
jgi:ABC-type cobalamin/Fe3+-siderophores transport system ATPase subunit